MTMPTAPRRRFPFGRLIFATIAGFILTGAVGAGAIFAYQDRYQDRVYPGVSVDGVDLAGLDRGAAGARLEQAMAHYGQGTVRIAAGNQSVSIPYSALGRVADVATLVDQAMAIGRATDGVAGVAEGVRTLVGGTALGPRVVMDSSAVATAVEKAVGPLAKPPVNATAVATSTGFTTTASASGLEVDEADIVAQIERQLADPAAPDTITVTARLTATQPAVGDADAAAAVAMAQKMVGNIVLTHDKDSWTIPAATVRSWISFASMPGGGYVAVVSPSAPIASLTGLAKKVVRAPVEASFLIGNNNKVVGVTAGKAGRALDVNATAALVAQAVEARAAADAPLPQPAVAIAVISTNPKLTTEQAQKAAPLMTAISSWTTYYPVGIANGFSANITIPARAVNGMVIPPGGVFDFWKAIGEVSTAKGYKMGGAIINGRSEPTGALGGGLCSASTTMFNAAARAGLEILSRSAHFYYISRYPLGLDATVLKTDTGAQTMSFRNDTPYPILIRSYAIPGTVRFTLYSVPTGRHTSFTKPIVKNVRPPGPTVEQYTTTLAPGVREVAEFPATGMEVWVTRTVTDASGKVIHRETYYSNYARVNGLILIGQKATTAAPTPTPTP